MGRRAAAGILVVLALMASPMALSARAEDPEAPPRIGSSPGTGWPLGRSPDPLDALDGLPGISELVDGWRRAQELDLEEYSYGTSVHDLSGDGLDDVAIGHFIVRSNLSSESGFRTVVKLDLVDGRNGTRLWTRRWEKDGYAGVFPVDAMTGKVPANGLWLVHYQDTNGLIEIDSFSFNLEFEAVDARGRSLWIQQFETTYIFPLTGFTINGLISADLFDGIGGKQTDLLVGTGQHVDAGTTSVSVIQTQVVEGLSGALTDHGLPLHSVNFLPYPDAVGDLDADGKDDYVIMMSGPYTGMDQEDTPFVTVDGVVIARKGSDGSGLWETPLDVGRYAWVSDSAQVTASTTEDLVITTFDYDFVQFGIQIPDLPLGFITNFVTKVHLFEGSTGSYVWVRPGEDAYVPGDIDGDDKGEVVTLATVGGDDSIGTKLRAYTYSGELLYKRTHRFAPATRKASFFSWWWWGLAGDVQPDRLIDLYIGHELGGVPGLSDGEAMIIDPSAGDVQARLDPEVYPLGEALVGRGDDLFQSCWQPPGTISALALSGDSGAVLWGRSLQFDVPAAHKQTYAYGEGHDVTPGPSGDLLMTVNTLRAGYVAVLDGRSGTSIWIKQIHGIDNKMTDAPLDEPICD